MSSGNYDFLKEKVNTLTYEQMLTELKPIIEPISGRFTKKYSLDPKSEEMFEK